LIEEKTGGYVGTEDAELLSKAMNDISNLDENEKLFKRNGRRRLFNLGNRLRHSDSSYRSYTGEVLTSIRT